MMNNQKYLGSYYYMGVMIHIQELDGKLAATMPGIPAGYEIQLEPVRDDAFRMNGGPVDGSTALFVQNKAGEYAFIKIGNIELARISPERVASLPVTESLLAPVIRLTPEKQAYFKELFEKILAKSNGDWIEYQLPYPKQEFVRYVMELDTIIFHGSNNRDIDTFMPVRTSVELYDKSGRGNLPAVYGTHDGLWAMFFAVVDRQKLQGSIRNGVMYFHNQAGEQLAVYHFSINQEQLAEQPWTEGVLYFLPRESFERQRMTPESYSNEWASFTPVKPVAKLSIKPDEFPFLQQIGGHDDRILIQAQALADTIRAAATMAHLDGQEFTVTIPDTEELADNLKEFVEIQRVLMPVSQFRIEKSTTGLTLVIQALPPAYQQVYQKNYAELLDVSRF